jgi:ABC-type nitrate/sulfonate/bicarbonate transport system ATPase subunit
MFVTHSIPEAIFPSDRVIVMNRGPAVIVGDVNIAVERPHTLERRGSPPLGDQAVEIHRTLEYWGPGRGLD